MERKELILQFHSGLLTASLSQSKMHFQKCYGPFKRQGLTHTIVNVVCDAFPFVCGTIVWFHFTDENLVKVCVATLGAGTLMTGEAYSRQAHSAAAIRGEGHIWVGF